MLDIVAFDDRTQQHPSDSNLPEWLPKHEFLMIIIAPAGSGKTTLLLNIILRAYKQYWQRIRIFSPTINNDAKWEHVKTAKGVLMPSERQERAKKDGAQKEEPSNKEDEKNNNKGRKEEEGEDWCVSEGVDNIMTMKENQIIDPFDRTSGGKAGRRKRIGLSKEWYEKAIGIKASDDKQPDDEATLKIYQQEKKVQRERLLSKNQRLNRLSAVIVKPPVPEMHKQLKDLGKSVYKQYHQKPPPLPTKIERPAKLERAKAYTPNTRGNDDKDQLKIPEEDMYEEYSEDTLNKEMDDIDEMVKEAKKEGTLLELASKMDRALWVFDDMVGSGLFNLKRDNPFKRLTVRRRHYYSSLIGVTQAYKEIPKTTRTNANCLILFRIDSKEELTLIYKEYPMGLAFKDWLKLVEYCTYKPYTFALFNLQTSDPNYRIVRNFDEPLSIETQTKILGHPPREPLDTDGYDPDSDSEY